MLIEIALFAFLYSGEMDINRKHSQRLKDLERKTEISVQFADMKQHIVE